jgi:acid ceramidase
MQLFITVGLTTLFSCLLFADATPPEGIYAPKCRVGEGLYDPAQAAVVPWLTVDLDLPPELRYREIYGPFGAGMKEVIDTIKMMGTIVTGDFLIPLIEHLMQYAHDELFPSKYAKEIDGIAESTGLSVADLAMMNIYYELSRFCTSIVAENTNGQVFHARNLDFGQLFVWDIEKKSWHLTEALKKITVNLNFVKDGKVIFKGTTFAGHLGIITGMKMDQFTLSMNAKVKPDIGNVIKWLTGGYNGTDIHFAMWAEREVMEKANTFQEAKEFLSDIVQLAGCYYILGGKNHNEGVIIVRNETDVLDYVEMNTESGKWYVLQTNYDPDQEPLFIDDRRTPGNKCMMTLGQSNVSASGIYEVLSSKTTLNKTTAHTVIMSIATGLYETFIQNCPDPCWFL